MLKVMTIVGTRPELIKLCRVIDQLDRHLKHVLVHSGQNFDYELNQIFFDQLAIRRPDEFLNAAGGSAMETIAKVLTSGDRALRKHNPDAVLILGDTNSCLSALAAKRRKIPVFHMEAGNRCFDQRVPEEINRKIVDHIADMNLVYSDISREYLLREGLPPDRIIKMGSPMFEVLNHYLPKIKQSVILKELKLSAGKYFLVSCHREENINSPKTFKNFIAILNGLVTEYHLPVIVSTHPRTRKMIESEKIKVESEVQFLKPFGF